MSAAERMERGGLVAAEPHEQPNALGDFIRAQRQLANLSLRQMSALTEVSNPYLSQIERGLHEPSVRVLKAIAAALNISAENLLAQSGLLEGDDDAEIDTAKLTEAAIRADSRLTEAQKRALLSVYRSYVEANTESDPASPGRTP
jgi:transcriptional regulator with XRE-family HTH domain